jgi:exosome complex RNA-binding protein Rrp42 (RNase PH superfamily)
MAIKELAKALKSGVRYVIATRIIELARRGERDPDQLRDRLITEACAANGNGSASVK